jgi:hypothetical protein
MTLHVPLLAFHGRCAQELAAPPICEATIGTIAPERPIFIGRPGVQPERSFGDLDHRHPPRAGLPASSQRYHE